MKFLAAAAALISVMPGVWSALTVNTPMSVTQCQPQLLEWSGGQAPYYLTIIPGGQAAAEPLKSFPAQSGNSMTWTVDLPSGTRVTISIKDGTGATQYSDVVTIHSSSDSSCLNGSPPPPNNAPPPQQAAYASATDSASTLASALSSGAPVPAASSSSRATLAAVGTPINRPAGTTVLAVPTNNNQQVSSSIRPTGTTPPPAGTSPTGANTSGAQSRLNIGASLVFAGVLGFFGATFL